MVKKAVLIGIKYLKLDAGYQLGGAITDVMRMRRCLIEFYGFLDKDITVLIDTDNSYTRPTKNNIRNELDNLVRSAKPGDCLFVHFSGHGCRLDAAADDKDDDTGVDECIVPCDMDPIKDDELKKLVSKIPSGSRLTFVSDSCHSGGLIEGAKEQIGDSSKKNGHGFGKGVKYFIQAESTLQGEKVEIPNVKNRQLPAHTLKDFLKQRTYKDDIDVRNGDLGCAAFLEMVGNLVSESCSGFFRMFGIGASSNCGLPENGVLLSSCQTYEPCVDKPDEENPPESYGVFSNVIQKIIAETNGAVTNKELIMKARELLGRQAYNQKPGLYCSDSFVDARFIC